MRPKMNRILSEINLYLDSGWEREWPHNPIPYHTSATASMCFLFSWDASCDPRSRKVRIKRVVNQLQSNIYNLWHNLISHAHSEIQVHMALYSPWKPPSFVPRNKIVHHSFWLSLQGRKVRHSCRDKAFAVLLFVLFILSIFRYVKYFMFAVWPKSWHCCMDGQRGKFGRTLCMILFPSTNDTTHCMRVSTRTRENISIISERDPPLNSTNLTSITMKDGDDQVVRGAGPCYVGAA